MLRGVPEGGNSVQNHRTPIAPSYMNRLFRSRSANAGPLALAVIILAVGFMTVGCRQTADLLDAALMHPVLVEDFEAPVIAAVARYPAGESLQTRANRWGIDAGGIEIVNATGHPDTAVSDGQQAVHLTGSMTTSFPTTRKKQYTLTLHYARDRRLGIEPGRAHVEVLGGGPTLLEAEISHTEVAFDSYRRYTGTFTADSPQSTLRFTSLTGGPYGITLDGISVRAVPPPLPMPPPPPR